MRQPLRAGNKSDESMRAEILIVANHHDSHGVHPGGPAPANYLQEQ